MKKTLRVYPGKSANEPENLLVSPANERTTGREKPAQGSLQSDSSRPEQQASHRNGKPANKRKERHKSFIAFAFVLLFASLCGISLLRQKSVSAVAAHSSSATLHNSASTSLNNLGTSPSIPVDCTNPANISNNSCYGGGDPGTPAPAGPNQGDYVLGSNCTNTYQNADKTDTMCWNDNDFIFYNRDISCIENDNLTQELQTFSQYLLANQVGLSQSTPTNANGTPNTLVFNSQLRNQNSCLDEDKSTCYSNNASHNDDNGGIHDQIGGDDITCYNNVCMSSNQGGTSMCGTGQPFDKFGCSLIESASNGTGTTTFYFNPTAYNPSGALEIATTNVEVNTPFQINATQDSPVCDASNHWDCPANEAVTILLFHGVTPFTGSPEMLPTFTAPNASNALFYSTAPWGTAFPPTYSVLCSSGSDWFFPCSNLGYSSSSEGIINEGMIRADWLSGDGGVAHGSGHLTVTYLDDTVSQPNVQALFNLMLAVGYVLLTPFLLLIGYQMLWASWTLGRANAMEAFGRLLLSIIALTASWQLASMLITLDNTFNAAVVFLHVHIPYPTTQINSQNLTYTLDGESDPLSYRGIVIPISQWGCTMNDFMKILGQKLLTDMSGMLPFIGGLVKLGLGIFDAVDVFKHIGEFIELIFSIMLATQIFMRLILINYYILTGPVALACWALPGGTGQKVVAQWFKGFCSLLFVQGVQLFILTTLPLIVPSFPSLPSDTFGLVNIFFAQLPRIIVLMAVVQAPKMMGTGATKAIAQAGTVAGGAVVAVGAAAYNVV